MFTASGVLFCIFFVVQNRLAKLPMLPAKLFQYGRSTNTLIFINIFIGWVYWGNLFCIPLYLQNIHGLSPAQAGLFILPMVIAHGLTSGLTGIIISVCSHYKPVIITGAVCWLVGAIAKLKYDQSTPRWILVVVGIFDGVGVLCSQVALLYICLP